MFSDLQTDGAGFRGSLEGCGKQSAFALASVLGWYGVGIPAAATAVFVLQWGLEGIWLGMDFGNTFVVLFMACVGLRINFAAEAERAQARARSAQGHGKG